MLDQWAFGFGISERDLAKEIAGVSLDTRAGRDTGGMTGIGGPRLLAQPGSRPVTVLGGKSMVDPDNDNDDNVDEKRNENGKSSSHISVNGQQRAGRGDDSGSESGSEERSGDDVANGGSGMEKITVKIVNLGNCEYRLLFCVLAFGSKFGARTWAKLSLMS